MQESSLEGASLAGKLRKEASPLPAIEHITSNLSKIVLGKNKELIDDVSSIACYQEKISFEVD